MLTFPIKLDIVKKKYKGFIMKNVFVIDPSIMIHKIIDLTFKDDPDYKVKFFSSYPLRGDEGQKADYIFITIDLAGVEIEDTLKELKNKYNCPIIAMVPKFLDYNRDQILSSGANYIIEKPFTSEELKNALATLSDSMAMKERSIPEVDSETFADVGDFEGDLTLSEEDLFDVDREILEQEVTGEQALFEDDFDKEGIVEDVDFDEKALEKELDEELEDVDFSEEELEKELESMDISSVEEEAEELEESVSELPTVKFEERESFEEKTDILNRNEIESLMENAEEVKNVEEQMEVPKEVEARADDFVEMMEEVEEEEVSPEIKQSLEHEQPQVSVHEEIGLEEEESEIKEKTLNLDSESDYFESPVGESGKVEGDAIEYESPEVQEAKVDDFVEMMEEVEEEEVSPEIKQSLEHEQPQVSVHEEIGLEEEKPAVDVHEEFASQGVSEGDKEEPLLESEVKESIVPEEVEPVNDVVAQFEEQPEAEVVEKIEFGEFSNVTEDERVIFRDENVSEVEMEKSEAKVELEEKQMEGVEEETIEGNIEKEVQGFAEDQEIRLSDEDVERIAVKVIERLSDRIIKEIAWEVIPQLAEDIVLRRIKELEKEIE